MAAASIANIVKSSFGPVGLDKMLVDDIGVSIYLIALACLDKSTLF
jgi:chaperonin GroEL (HSP60 family)